MVCWWRGEGNLWEIAFAGRRVWVGDSREEIEVRVRRAAMVAFISVRCSI